MPLGIQGINGILVMKVCENDVPPIIPMPTLKELGMVMDSVNERIIWTRLHSSRPGRENDPPPVSAIFTLPSSHITIDGSAFSLDHYISGDGRGGIYTSRCWPAPWPRAARRSGATPRGRRAWSYYRCAA